MQNQRVPFTHRRGSSFLLGLMVSVLSINGVEQINTAQAEHPDSSRYQRLQDVEQHNNHTKHHSFRFPEGLQELEGHRKFDLRELVNLNERYHGRQVTSVRFKAKRANRRTHPHLRLLVNGDHVDSTEVRRRKEYYKLDVPRDRSTLGRDLRELELKASGDVKFYAVRVETRDFPSRERESLNETLRGHDTFYLEPAFSLRGNAKWFKVDVRAPEGLTQLRVCAERGRRGEVCTGYQRVTHQRQYEKHHFDLRDIASPKVESLYLETKARRRTSTELGHASLKLSRQ